MRTKIFVLIILFLCSYTMNAMDIIVTGNIIDGKLVVGQEHFQISNTNYIIKKVFDLDGKRIVLPENSKLTFSGRGRLVNGVVVGCESDLSANRRKTIFSKVQIDGIWKVNNIYSSWFDFGSDAEWNTRYMQNLCGLTSNDYYGNIFISKGKYKVNVSNRGSSCMYVNSNTDMTIDGVIELQPCEKQYYGIICIVDVQNVNIKGKGAIVGDVIGHIGDSGEWGMGLDIRSSKNVTVRGITIMNCWGDCIYVGQTKEEKGSYSEGVLLENVTCSAGRRQGLSIITGKNIFVRNCNFKDIGSIRYTPPGAGIDIEPNRYGETVLENIYITDCVFKNNYAGKDFSSFNLDKTVSIYVGNCSFEGGIVMNNRGYNVTFDRCDIKCIIYISRENTGNILFKDSRFREAPPRHLIDKDIIKIENCATL